LLLWLSLLQLMLLATTTMTVPATVAVRPLGNNGFLLEMLIPAPALQEAEEDNGDRY
jgi:hypothetical protein